MCDIIPDVREKAGKLRGALRYLGYSERRGARRHSEPKSHVINLFDFVDFGLVNRGLIRADCFACK